MFSCFQITASFFLLWVLNWIVLFPSNRRIVAALINSKCYMTIDVLVSLRLRYASSEIKWSFKVWLDCVILIIMAKGLWSENSTLHLIMLFFSLIMLHSDLWFRFRLTLHWTSIEHHILFREGASNTCDATNFRHFWTCISQITKAKDIIIL